MNSEKSEKSNESDIHDAEKQAEAIKWLFSPYLKKAFEKTSRDDSAWHARAFGYMYMHVPCTRQVLFSYKLLMSSNLVFVNTPSIHLRAN